MLVERREEEPSTTGGDEVRVIVDHAAIPMVRAPTPPELLRTAPWVEVCGP